jgi:hypothetical protein
MTKCTVLLFFCFVNHTVYSSPLLIVLCMLTGSRKKCLLSHVLSSSLLTPLQIDSGASILDNYVKKYMYKEEQPGYIMPSTFAAQKHSEFPSKPFHVSSEFRSEPFCRREKHSELRNFVPNHSV